MNVAGLQIRLNFHGFPCGSPDGLYGPKTTAAVQRLQQASTLWHGPADGLESEAVYWVAEQLPYLSENFATSELQSKGNRDCYVRKELVFALEVLRAWANKPIPVVSGYRDPAHNQAVGGARRSLHTFGERSAGRYRTEGLAVDLSRKLNLKLDDVIDLRVFSGVGYLRKSKRVTHLDVRHIVNRGGTPQNPRTWAYHE